MANVPKYKTNLAAKRDWICPKCMKVFCGPGVRQAEVLKAFDRHLSEIHKIYGDKVKIPGAGSRREGNANRPVTEKPRTETRRSVVRGSSPRSEPTSLPDTEWDASTQGNIAFHQSPHKTGSDGFAIYERSMYGEGVLDTLLKHPEMMRTQRPHLQFSSVPTIEIRVHKQPNPQPPSVYVQVPKTLQGKDLAVIAQAPAQSRPAIAGRTDAAAQLGQALMKRLREIDTIAGNAAVLPCCSAAELLEALRILQSVAVRIAKQARKKQT